MPQYDVTVIVELSMRVSALHPREAMEIVFNRLYAKDAKSRTTAQCAPVEEDTAEEHTQL